ncbi:NAD(P)/FAD-dependent oxidoreductase [Janibacter sp. GS2]|uniref:NAD(P)/FAD-dependent oxidoreductase n=1 Tax=Janibacter sp. GS2 TaxID=3442646 RepID=UPI003EB8D1D4
MSENTTHPLPDGVVIVGGGQSAAVAARTLRRKKYTGPITIVGEEPHRPYQRPPLSKEYLEDPEASVDLLPTDWTQAQDVTVRTDDRVERVETGPVVVTSSGDRLPASAVLLATGGTPRTLGGATGERIHHLRTRDDADRLRAALASGSSLVIVGAGFIGAEIASAARAAGVEVTVVEAAEQPMHRALGPDLGRVCSRLQRDHGVDLRLSTGVNSLQETAAGVVLDTDAGQISADHAVVAIGIVPDTAVAVASGIECDNGILVDASGRTSMPGVWAAGDVANQDHPQVDGRIRVEHFDNASKQASVAAQSMLGADTTNSDPHWYWSDQFGVNLQGVGQPHPGDEMVVRGDLGSDSFTAFFLREGAVAAVFALNDEETVGIARELVNMNLTVPLTLLTDPERDLFEALEGAAT